MADHGHGQDHGKEPGSGTMDIRDKEKTFEGFIRMTMWGAGISIGILVFLALSST